MAENKFFSILGGLLVILNIASLFFLISLMAFYAALDYGLLPVHGNIKEYFSDSSFWSDKLQNIVELIYELPSKMDWLFLAVIGVITINLYYVSFVSKRMGWFTFFFTLLLGLPIWLYISTELIKIRDKFLEYFSSALVEKPDTPFFDYFTNYTIEISAFLFLTAIIINVIDWGEVREKVQSKISGEDDSATLGDTLEETFNQEK